MPMFDPITNFRFWCHKIIPLVYDESLSYYEFLCKVMQKLNEAIDTLNQHSAEIERFETDLLAQFEAFRIEIRERITTFENLFVTKYSTEKNYLEGDIVTNNDKLLVATDSTSGDFDPTKWDEIVFADYFVEWRRELSEQVIQFVTNITNKLDTWLSNIASNYDSSHEYTAGDIVKRNDLLYIANTDTTGDFDLNDWDTLVLCDWLADIIRRYDEALDSISVTVNNCEKRKANITDTNIVSKSMKSSSVQGEQTGYYLATYNLTTIAGVTVFVINFNSLGNNTPANKAAFIESMTKCALGTTAGPTTATEKTVKWYNECGIVAFNTSANTGVALWFYNDTSVQNVGVNITQYDLSNIGTSFKAAYVTEQGAGFADVNNLAMHYDAKLENCETDINTNATNITALQEKTKTVTTFLTPKSGEYYNPNLPVTLFVGTRYETFNSSATVTIPNEGTFYVYSLAADTVQLARGAACEVTLYGANVPVYIGKGATPADAYANAITMRKLVRDDAGNVVYIPCESIAELESGENIFILVNTNDTVQSYIYGTVIVSTAELPSVNSAGTFMDVTYNEACYNFDSRISTTEGQLGGKSIVALTEAEYALITPDPDTLYFAY